MLAALFSFALLAVGSSQPTCPENTYLYLESCVETCPMKSYYRECKDACPTGTFDYNNNCVDTCPIETYAYFSDCVSTCPDGTYIYNGNCVGGCPARTYNRKCVDSCPEGTYDYNNGCLDSCPMDTITDGNRCSESCPSGFYKYQSSCVESCPSEASYIYNNECYNECWKYGLYYESAGSKTCVNSCPTVYEWKSSTCVERCRPEQKVSANACYDSCPSSIPYADGDTCVLNCPRYIDMATNNCVDVCPSGTTLNGDRCEDQTQPVCNTNQYLGPDNDCRDIPTCSSTQYLGSDYKCYDYPTYSPQATADYTPRVTPSPQPSYIKNNYTNPCIYQNADGHCVDYSYNYTNPCGADQWMLNNTCIPACKEGEFMDINGNCMNPADMCKRGLPGGVYNYDTHICECPQGHWIQRDESFVPPVACSRVSSSIPSPWPRINCPSFIPYTVYKPEIENCVCDADYPVIIRNPKDTFLPFSCAASGTETTIRPCDGGMYFDFMNGKCVYSRYFNDTVITITPVPTYTVRPSYTPMPSACPAGTVMLDGKCQREVTPSPSMCPRGTVMMNGGCKELASQTSTAMPSRKASASSTPSRSAKPSDRPNSATSTPSASRSMKPSNRIFADVSRKPLPSIEFKPPPANVQRSPAPSAWPKKMIMDIPQEERPAYIEAKVKLSGGNVTEMSKPEKIQDMQASLACTLRMPLENIRITNITYVDEKGLTTKVDVDPTKFMMMGDGEIGCYSRNKTTSGRRMLRSDRELQSKGAINVDYSIIQPSDDILFMDTVQMNSVIGTSPIMIELASSIGSSSIESSAVEASYNAAPSANPSGVVTSSTGTDSKFSTFQAMVGGGVVGFVIFAGLVVVSAFYYKENKRNKRLLKEQQENKPVVVTQQPRQIILQFNGEQIQNPMSVIKNAIHHADSTRFDYGPETTRPLKPTHKSLV